MSPEKQLASFISKYSPEIARQAKAALNKMRGHLPGAIELVYDNYNALAIGFGPSEKTSDVVFSIAVYPRWVTLFFMTGASLNDPEGVLQGSGNVARHVVLKEPGTIDSPAVQKLMKAALKSATKKIDSKQPNRIVIKSISPKQRPRRREEPATEK